MPVAMMRASRRIARALFRRAWLKSARMGTAVEVLKRESRSEMEKNMAMLKGQAVPKPMKTVPMMAMGTIRSGWWTSSARCVAQSRQAKA